MLHISRTPYLTEKKKKKKKNIAYGLRSAESLRALEQTRDASVQTAHTGKLFGRARRSRRVCKQRGVVPILFLSTGLLTFNSLLPDEIFFYFLRPPS